MATIRISETKLKNMISEHVKRVITKKLNEGSVQQEDYNKWLDFQEMLGAEQMLDCIWNYLDSDQIREILDCLGRDYSNDYDEDYEDDY